MSRLSIAVIQGGPSSEAEVSRASAASIQKALVGAGHHAVRLELDPFLAETIRGGAFDVAFPATHGAVGEDGCLQGLLEVVEIPYVGSDVLGSALAMHKRVARRLFAAEGLPIARGASVRRGEKTAAELRKEIGARLVVKPSSHGSAIGVARIEADAPDDELTRALEAAWALDPFAVVEHFAKGREVTCGVLELDDVRALPPTEVIAPKDAFYTYEARYAPGRSVHQCPPDLPASVIARIQEVAIGAHRALGCRDLSRVDFVVGDEGDPDAVTLLEVNTLPGFTDTSLFPEAAQIAGIPMPKLCEGLARKAHRRGTTMRVAARPLPK